MGLEIVWSKNALKTLKLAHKEYSEIVGSLNSQFFIESLIEKVSHLKHTPYLGKSIKFNNNSFNYFIHSHYKIIYHIKVINNIEKAIILLIFDTRQDPNKLIEKLKNL